MSEDRIAALEEAVAHHERAIGELSDQVAEQWRTIDGLKRIIERLGERIEGVEAGFGETAPVTRPPHY